MRLRVTFLRRKTVSLQSNIGAPRISSKMATIDEFALKNKKLNYFEKKVGPAF
jgi:hypothetical protein